MSNEVVDLGLKLYDRRRSVLSWLGPTTLMIIFIALIVVTATTLLWYLNEDTTSGWVLSFGIISAILCLFLFYAYYDIIKSTGIFVLDKVANKINE